MARTSVLVVLLGLAGCDGSRDVCGGAVDEAVQRWERHAASLAVDGGLADARRAAAKDVIAALERSPTEAWVVAQGYPAADAPASFRDVWAATRGAALACAAP